MSGAEKELFFAYGSGQINEKRRDILKLYTLSEGFYIYEITRKNKVWTGIAASVDKEECQVLSGCHKGASVQASRLLPCTCVYQEGLKSFIEEWKVSHEPVKAPVAAGHPDVEQQAFTDGEFVHRAWKIGDQEAITFVQEKFADVSGIYTFSAAALQSGEAIPAVIFPSEEVPVRPCHRLVKDLNGIDERAFLNSLKFSFELVGMPFDFPCRPVERHSIGMYAAGGWYLLTAYPDVYEKKDAVGQLDLSVLKEKIFKPILNIGKENEKERVQVLCADRRLSEARDLAEDCGGAFFILYPMEVEELIEFAKKDIPLPEELYYFETELKPELLV